MAKYKNTNSTIDTESNQSASAQMNKRMEAFVRVSTSIDSTMKTLNNDQKKLNSGNDQLRNLNERYQKMFKEAGELKAKQIAAQNGNRPVLTSEEAKKLSEFTSQLGVLEQQIEKKNIQRTSLNNKIEQTKQDLGTFYNLQTKADGTYTLKTNQDGGVHFKSKVTPELVQIMQKLQGGQKITDSEAGIIQANSNDPLVQKAVNSFYENKSQGYKYNIINNLNEVAKKNEKLFDIRNYKNFRATLSENSNNNNSNFTENIQGNGTSLSRSFYMSKNDFYWSENFNIQYDSTGNRLLQNPIQNIILNEYQPKFNYSLAARIQYYANDINEFLKGLLDVPKLEDITAEGTAAGSRFAAETLKNNLSKNPETLYAEEGYKEKSNPMYAIQQLFEGGKWLNTYELPFVNKTNNLSNYLDVGKDSGRWNVGGIDNNIGGGKLSDTLTQYGITLAFPTLPTFTLDTPLQHTKDDITIQFNLINKNDEWLSKNFEFMHALFAGSAWLSMTYGTICPTNVYNVLVPGRFLIHWASIQTQWTAVGKLRNNRYMFTKYGSTIKSIQQNTLWPESWQLTLIIKPISQYNFNTYIDYFIHGFGGKNQITRLQDLTKSKEIPTAEQQKAEQEKHQNTAAMIQSTISLMPR